MKYDREEKTIIDAYEKGVMKLSKPSKKETETIKATAKKTLVKNRRITIRLYDHDYQGIQKKAMEMGIPQYIEGDLISRPDRKIGKGMLKSAMPVASTTDIRPVKLHG